ncbi:uncharacterized protein BJ212DRAFT_912281 [Suillus subaureus]|uniref:Uncharacterized protein n=1 Tax=Suillus subaureus TaxID=48587 RepID=A0A9P7EIB7_9AGAM|nr:uncharacterized protein BJ212DRAFT_912281 [Suillus subaureus]KAG1821645.1 hypothetical protein BJ212DRAFT_912281 [Suillus subaureus]
MGRSLSLKWFDLQSFLTLFAFMILFRWIPALHGFPEHSTTLAMVHSLYPRLFAPHCLVQREYARDHMQTQSLIAEPRSTSPLPRGQAALTSVLGNINAYHSIMIPHHPDNIVVDRYSNY